MKKVCILGRTAFAVKRARAYVINILQIATFAATVKIHRMFFFLAVVLLLGGSTADNGVPWKIRYSRG